MLRYFNLNRIDQGPNPGMPVDRTYFFTTLFESSLYGFVGKPGRIYGYEMVAASRDCADSGAATTNISSWMTIITAADGSLITANIMPDDDNTLTITKGTTSGLADAVVAGSATGTVDISYMLGSGKLGTLYGFTAALDDVAVGSEVTGVTFESTHPDGDQCGAVRIRRGL